MKKNLICLLSGIVNLSVGIFAADFDSSLKPFPFAARPAQGTAADCSYMNTPITEAQRISTGSDGHLYAAGKRLRIFGTNVSAFPPVEDAEYWAKTIAAQGYNCIRFHHTDSDWADCFFKQDKNTNKIIFNEKAFERFDKFFYELKKAGVYSNINLLTGRTIRPDDKNKLPQELNKVTDWKDRHCYGFWNELAREDQRKYAEKILNHKNPYTGLTYAEDPAVAFVEVNNENSMSKAYLDGALSRFPDSLTKELDIKWTDFLAQKGWNYKKLEQTFNQSEKLGNNLLLENTNLEQHSGAKAELNKNKDNSIIKVTQNGTEGWHIQYDYYGFTTEAEQLYTISFKAKASNESSVSVSVMMNHDPWSNLGFSKSIKLTKNWQDFSFTVSSLQTDARPRLTFGDMGKSTGTTFEFADVKFCKGGSTIAVEKADDFIKFPSFDTYRALPLELKLLVTQFIVELDSDYWTSMNDFLKKNLKIKALTFGTALPCAPATVMNSFDIVDSHAYWHHPSFPGDSWNTKDYFVKNQSLVTADDGGTLSTLAKLRIYGKPFSVTEYDHPYPNQFTSEMVPMLAVFASLQDWDCIYTFCYEISQRNPDKVKITGYFDQANNPSKIAAIPVAARIFREFRIKPFEKSVHYTITPQTELKAIAQKGGAWNVVPPDFFDSTLAKKSFQNQIGGIILKDGENTSRAVPVSTNTESASARVFNWNSRGGYFIYSDEDIFVSITMPGVKPQEQFTSELSFIPQNDFAAVAGVKLGASRWFVFSGSWSGNDSEKLYEYGKKPKSFPRFSKTRSVVNLTTEYSGSGTIAVALGSNGTIKLNNTIKGWKLYPLNQDGTVSKQQIKPTKEGFTVSETDNTLWYEVRKE